MFVLLELIHLYLKQYSKGVFTGGCFLSEIFKEKDMLSEEMPRH